MMGKQNRQIQMVSLDIDSMIPIPLKVLAVMQLRILLQRAFLILYKRRFYNEQYFCE